MTFIGLLTLVVLVDILKFLHKIIFCGIHCRAFIALRHERRFALRLFNVGSEKFLKAGFAEHLLHGSDAEDFALIGVEACILHGGGNNGFTGVLAVGTAFDQFPPGPFLSADSLLKGVFLYIGCPGSQRIDLAENVSSFAFWVRSVSAHSSKSAFSISYTLTLTFRGWKMVMRTVSMS